MISSVSNRFQPMRSGICGFTAHHQHASRVPLWLRTIDGHFELIANRGEVWILLQFDYE
jgi:hypothetical protein